MRGEEEEEGLTDDEFDEEKENVEHQQKRDPRRTRKHCLSNAYLTLPGLYNSPYMGLYIITASFCFRFRRRTVTRLN